MRTVAVLASLVLSAAIVAGAPAPSAADGAFLPFVLPWDDASKGPADVSFLLDAPAGKAGAVTARDGHFFTGDRRIRFWGVNMCFSACFPEESVAPLVAARLAKFGVNCVRYHHMDMNPFPNGIFVDAKLEELSPEALARFDRLFAEMKKCGIYANLNLHVSRFWSRAHAWPGANELEDFDKMLDLFHPELIAAQKKYARDLLLHRNPHTGLTYAEDPAVAMVEITNEDSLFMWSAPRMLPKLPEPYAKILAGEWNVWLVSRYGDDAKLRSAWSTGAAALGKNLLKDPGFASLRVEEKKKSDAPSDTKGAGKKNAAKKDTPKKAVAEEKKAPRSPVWQLEQHENAAMEAAAGDEPGAVRITIARVSGTNWHLQFKQEDLALKAAQFYTVSFRARAEAPKSIGVGVTQAHEPWGNVGLSEECALASEWRAFSFGFTCTENDKSCRLSFTVGGDTTGLVLADVALQPGGRTGLGDGESLAKSSVALYPTAFAVVESRASDRLAFLHDIELRYFTGMRDFLKNELGVKAPIAGTIAFGGLGTRVQAQLDFVDQHAYWQHPSFPRRPWDPSDWNINNVAMSASADGGCLPGLAVTRVAGKPYTVTEYNHPAPMDSQAETVPMIASFAAWQDWDGVFLFAYTHANAFAREKYEGFFDIDANPAKMGFMGAGALLFLGERLEPAAAAMFEPLTFDQALVATRKSGLNLLPFLRDRKFQWRDLLEKRFALLMEGASVSAQNATSAARIAWQPDKDGRYLVDGPSAKVACGKLGGAPLEFDGVRIEVRSPSSVSLLLVARDRATIADARELLLVACGRCENTGMTWNAKRTSVGARWGKAPVRIEAVEAKVVLRTSSSNVRIQRLDGRGQPAGEIPWKAANGAIEFTLGGANGSLWYVIEK
jgi:hypothetical protein